MLQLPTLKLLRDMLKKPDIYRHEPMNITDSFEKQQTFHKMRVKALVSCGIYPPIAGSLVFAGLDTLEKISKLTANELLDVKQIGISSVLSIIQVLHKHGLALIDEQLTQVCKHCGKRKSLDEFYGYIPYKEIHHHAWCKDCREKAQHEQEHQAAVKKLKQEIDREFLKIRKLERQLNVITAKEIDKKQSDIRRLNKKLSFVIADEKEAASGTLKA